MDNNLSDYGWIGLFDLLDLGGLMGRKSGSRPTIDTTTTGARNVQHHGSGLVQLPPGLHATFVIDQRLGTVKGLLPALGRHCVGGVLCKPLLLFLPLHEPLAALKDWIGRQITGCDDECDGFEV